MTAQTIRKGDLVRPISNPDAVPGVVTYASPTHDLIEVRYDGDRNRWYRRRMSEYVRVER